MVRDSQELNAKMDKTSQGMESQMEFINQNLDNTKTIIDKNHYDANKQIHHLDAKLGETDGVLRDYMMKNNKEIETLKHGFNEFSKYMQQPNNEPNAKFTYVDSRTKEPSSSQGANKGKEPFHEYEEYHSQSHQNKGGYGRRIEFGQNQEGCFEKNNSRGSNGDFRNRDPNLNHHENKKMFPRLRIDFPRFNGKKAQDWVYKAQ
ncbi:unnamed protein product [Victoria cruziana]